LQLFDNLAVELDKWREDNFCSRRSPLLVFANEPSGFREESKRQQSGKESVWHEEPIIINAPQQCRSTFYEI
jgi:hypothetical protein